MEFKGTKGKWYVEPNETKGAWIGNSTNGFSALACGNTHEIAKANALLISKAPEMLEMLQRVIYDIDNTNNPYLEITGDTLDKIKQLIKQATEVNNE